MSVSFKEYPEVVQAEVSDTFLSLVDVLAPFATPCIGV